MAYLVSFFIGAHKCESLTINLFQILVPCFEDQKADQAYTVSAQNFAYITK